MNSSTGKWIILIGLVIVCIGLVVYFFHDKLGWIGKLPGDIRIVRENFSFYFPITTMILFSILMTIILKLVGWFFRGY